MNSTINKPIVDMEIGSVSTPVTDSSSSVTSADSWEDEQIVEPHVGYKKVLVTGGAGFIGSHIAECLLDRGDDVVIVDEVNDYYDTRIKEGNLKLLLTKYGPGRVSIFRGDICDEAFMLNVFETTRPEWVCHMAARAGVRPSVYGGSKSTFFSEDEAVDHPVSPYAATKKACELLAYTYHHLYNLNVTGLRFFTVYGPRGRPDMAPFKFIDRVSRGLQIQQFGDGSSSRDYTYISDIVDGVVRSIDRPHKYEIFNLGKGSGTSLKEFINLVQKHVGRKANIRVMPDQPGDVPNTCANLRKAERMLGYTSAISFEEGIERTADWYKEAYEQTTVDFCPELQANGLGRSPSLVNIQTAIVS